MPDWSKGFIYMLKHKDDINNENIYLGSSTNFRVRKNTHKTCCNNPNDRHYNEKKYKYIRENGGWDEWVMIEIEKYPCKGKRELEKREDDIMIQHINTLNTNRSFRNREQYDKDNRDIILKKKREYHHDNCKKISEKRANYYINNHDKILEKVKKYRDENIEKIKEYDKNRPNKQERYEKAKQKILCNNCGCMVIRSAIAQHKKTKKCINFKPN
jgi:hypothetical protein